MDDLEYSGDSDSDTNSNGKDANAEDPIIVTGAA